ncbi:unnamed protein product [Allacma fusca]|uniref:Uncharacterized protein n=1 Tax=Allacma fusca TaxID=39272 RepID=A0A8J2KBA4_9HEXA|nr:unnamed protein product [Allacma fusca]
MKRLEGTDNKTSNLKNHNASLAETDLNQTIHFEKLHGRKYWSPTETDVDDWPLHIRLRNESERERAVELSERRVKEVEKVERRSPPVLLLVGVV